MFASGSPFPPVQYRDRTLMPGQCNNMYIFPAVGLAVYATQAKRVTDEMFIAAAEAVAEQVTAAELEAGLIYPPQSTILKTETRCRETHRGGDFRSRPRSRGGAEGPRRLHRIADLPARIPQPHLTP